MEKYIILLDKDKNRSCGTDWSGICHYTKHYYIMQQAENMLQANKRAKYAYLVQDYTQKMCEMDNAEFSAHVQKIGKLLSINPINF